MKILLIRHADPNYEVDGLTQKGEVEARLLSDRLLKENISAIYCSTLGRARLTAAPTVERTGITPEYCIWLREFDYAKINTSFYCEHTCCWDLLAEYVGNHPSLYLPDKWYLEDIFKGTDVKECYDNVCQNFDKVLEKHGYIRDGVNYKVLKPNHDTVAFICHYGVISVLASHILNCSPYTVWQNAVALTTSVTTVYTEERREGIASLRMAGFGDISHLYAAGEQPSFSARFCECFTDDTRHD